MGAAYDPLAQAIRIYPVDPSTIGSNDGVGAPTASVSSAPATKLVAITKSDTTDLTPLKLRGLWVGGAGAVAVLATGDTVPVTLLAVPAGTLLQVQVQKVMATNTTATNIIGLA